MIYLVKYLVLLGGFRFEYCKYASNTMIIAMITVYKLINDIARLKVIDALLPCFGWMLLTNTAALDAGTL